MHIKLQKFSFKKLPFEQKYFKKQVGILFVLQSSTLI